MAFKKQNLNLRIDTNHEYVTSVALLVLLLIICNIAFILSSGWAKFGWSMLGYAGLAIVYWKANLKIKEVGLSLSNFRSGLKLGFICLAIVSITIGTMYLINPDFFQDERYNQSLSAALFASLILLPLKTVFFEELAFRGIIPALIIRFKSQRIATIVSSLAFGLWHVSTSLSIGVYDLGNSTVPSFIVVGVVITATTLAGIILCELRWRSGSLIAPIITHWFINASAIIIASLAWS